MKDTMIQYFEWDLPADRSLYKKLRADAKELVRTGFTMVWMPPATKGAAGVNDVGYGAYDLYDLGEFYQKGSQSTKYGTKNQYLQAISALHQNQIKVIADVVLNHKMGADELENAIASTVVYQDRNAVCQEPHDVLTWSHFTFPGRADRYSSFRWNWHHFTGTDYNEKTKQNDILLFEGKRWNDRVSHENGNYDFIMGCDVDFTNQEVLGELYEWGRWYTKTTQIDGFRLDAVKNIDSSFFPCWLEEMHRVGNHPNFTVGEFWSGNLWDLKRYLHDCGYCMRLMDVPLHYELQRASMSNGTYDIRNLFQNTLSGIDPDHACAFVDNHDTQPGQSLESWVMDWFKTAAYCSILLYRCQYPCVFYGDYYGMPLLHKGPVQGLKEMVWIRHHLLSDNIIDLFDEDRQKACWMAYGTHPVIVIYTIADWKEKIFTEPNYAGMTLIDVMDPAHKETFDQNGTIRITCNPGCASVYILEKDWITMNKDLKKKRRLRRKRS